MGQAEKPVLLATVFPDYLCRSVTREMCGSTGCVRTMRSLYLAVAQQSGVRATPTIFFGERQRLDGALPWADFQRAAPAGLAAQQPD